MSKNGGSVIILIPNPYLFEIYVSNYTTTKD